MLAEARPLINRRGGWQDRDSDLDRRVQRSAAASAELDGESDVLRRIRCITQFRPGPSEARAASQMMLPGSSRRDDAEPVSPAYALSGFHACNEGRARARV